jgi:hypothetical protein
VIRLLRLSGDLQFLEPLHDVLARSLGADLVVDVEDLAVGPDVEGPARRERVLGVDDAVGGGDFLLGIAQDRVIGLDMLGELLVRLGIVDAGGEIRDVRKGPDVFAALTERSAFGRSTTGEGFGEPGEDDRLALVVGQTVHLAVRSLQRERRRGITHFERGDQRRRRRL